MEESSFRNIPFADALAVRTVWLVDDGRVRVFFRADAAPGFPSWLERLLVAKTRAELEAVFFSWRDRAVAALGERENARS